MALGFALHTMGGAGALAGQTIPGALNVTGQLGVGSIVPTGSSLSIGMGGSVVISSAPNALNIVSPGALNLGGPVHINTNAAGTSADVHMGTSASGVANLSGLAFISTTAVGNIGASGPDDLITYTLPANSISANGKGVRVKAWGTSANNANAKTVRIMFGSVAMVTKQLTASVAGTWDIEAIVWRTGASTQSYYAKATNNGGTTVSSTDGATVFSLAGQGTGAETDTANIVIKGQSTVSTTDNDIVQQGMMVEYFN